MGNNHYLNILFQVGKSLFLVSSEYVSDIQYIPDSVTELPKAPLYMRKTCNSFGRVITMIDIGLLLGVKENTCPGKLIILNPPTKGIMVDNVLSVEHTEQFKEIEKSFAVPPIIKNFYVRTGRKEIILEVDIPNLLHRTTQ
ncbi:MAG: chemotaxis protein CheW [Butyrivibrio sp.]|nr:chemotaxis protein CheW [Butyrivibrio sp.]